jgi:hypothetical protein
MSIPKVNGLPRPLLVDARSSRPKSVYYVVENDGKNNGE